MCYDMYGMVWKVWIVWLKVCYGMEGKVLGRICCGMVWLAMVWFCIE